MGSPPRVNINGKIKQREIVHINCDDLDDSPVSYNEVEVSSTHSDESNEAYEEVSEVRQERELGKKVEPQ